MSIWAATSYLYKEHREGKKGEKILVPVHFSWRGTSRDRVNEITGGEGFCRDERAPVSCLELELEGELDRAVAADLVGG